MSAECTSALEQYRALTTALTAVVGLLVGAVAYLARRPRRGD